MIEYAYGTTSIILSPGLLIAISGSDLYSNPGSKQQVPNRAAAIE